MRLRHPKLTAPLVALLIASCAAAPAQTVRATPGIWRIADADTTIYLLGTIHLLPKSVVWRNARIDRIVADADLLVLEVAETGDAAAISARFTALARSQGQPPVLSRIPADRAERLKALASRAKQSLAALDRYETWGVALALSPALTAEAAASPAYGVDSDVKARFIKAGKPVIGLETIDAQFTIFDSLPEPEQRAFLVSVIDQSRQGTSYSTILGAWSRGNFTRIAALLRTQLATTPILYRWLVTDRNQSWSGTIAARLEQPGTVLVAVGAGHLAGPDSVQTMLAKRGVKAVRVQ